MTPRVFEREIVYSTHTNFEGVYLESLFRKKFKKFKSSGGFSGGVFWVGFCYLFSLDSLLKKMNNIHK